MYFVITLALLQVILEHFYPEVLIKNGLMPSYEVKEEVK